MNCRYESTSSESSSESSDDESDASEYHEATEKLPESPVHRPQATSASGSAVSVSKSTEIANVQYSNAPPLLSEGSDLHGLTQPPALDTVTCQHVIKSPASDSDRWHSAIQSKTAMAPQETVNQPTESASIQQYTTQTTAMCPEHRSIKSSTICMTLEQTVNQPQTTSSDGSQQNSNQPESSGLTTHQPTALSHTTGASHPGDSQSQTTDLTSYQQTVQVKAADASDQQDTSKSSVSSPTESASLNKESKQESRCDPSS